MADCFSLPNAAEILKNIRWMYADEYWVQRAADAIEALMQENAKLKSEVSIYDNTLEKVYADMKRTKAERDAAYDDIQHDCRTCAKEHGVFDALDRLHNGQCDEWKWRGVPKENADA